MVFAELTYKQNKYKVEQSSFGGLDARKGAEDGSIRDMRNMAAIDYPVLRPRPKRYTYTTLTTPNGFLVHDGHLIWVDGTDLYYDGTKVSGTAGLADSKKTMIAMGWRILIFPDKKYYNFADSPSEDRFGSLESSWSGSSLSFKNDQVYDEPAVCNGLYNASVDWTEYFRAGDAVTIAGCTTHTANNKTPIIREISEDGHTLRFSEGALTLHMGYTTTEALSAASYYFLDGGDYWGFTTSGSIAANTQLVWDGTHITYDSTTITPTKGQKTGTELTFGEDIEYSESGTLTVSRTLPDMDYVCVNENRLWGVKGKTIYASKLGDPFNFNVLGDGLSTDSYYVEDLTEGEFTGATSYLGYAIFFKENRILKIYGTEPENYQYMDLNDLGVAKDAGQSLATAGGYLFYYSRLGFMSYQGSTPNNIHQAFAGELFKKVISGSDGMRYYASCQRQDNSWILCVLDAETGLWHMEDATQAVRIDRKTKAWVLDSTGKLFDYDSSGTAESDFSWWAEFGDMTDEAIDRKGYSRYQLRLKVDSGATVTVKVQYDDNGVWHTLKTVGETNKAMKDVAINTRRCDHLRIKLEGTGYAEIYSLARQRYFGSEM